MYIVASTEVNDLFPYGDFLDLDLNQTVGNQTDDVQFSCLYEHFHALTNLTGCPPTHDSILCWPPTPLNTLATQKCYFTYNGLLYDVEDNATKFCNGDGTWEKAVYEYCIHTSPHPIPTHESEYNSIIYIIGYTLSIIVLTVAVIIFLTFKELRCLRNTIHCNLFITYIFSALLWLLTLSFQMSSSPGLAECIVLLTLMQFFNLTNFFWMMVEGLYLYLLVVETFSRIEVINRFAVYAIIGYGIPAVCAITWSIVKGVVGAQEDLLEFEIQCLWMHESSLDWIFKGPICAVLIINLIFLTSIMWVLITKLRSANTAETKQYRKASKALLVLIPLFGLTYLIVLYGPNEGIGKKIFDIARAFLLSTQGFFVALFYCFLNSEVRKAIRKNINRWRDARNIIRKPQFRHSSNQQTRRYTNNGANRSPQSRAESLRPLTCNTKKRESNVTTTTLLTEIPSNYSGIRDSNGVLQMNAKNTSPLIGLDENSV